MNQDLIVQQLLQPETYPHPVGDILHLQTHISHVFLAGDYAYKIKKPLDLGFLDFSTLERRRHCCEEEIRLNRRLAPDIYLETCPLSLQEQHLGFGGTAPIVEYAVRMRRFDHHRSLTAANLSRQLTEQIADRVAAFHQQIERDEDGAFGTPDAVLFPMQQNFDQIRQFLGEQPVPPVLAHLEEWTRETFQRLQPLLAQRKAAGFIRECHGDMHLGNMVLENDSVLIFDGIEFNPDLRWIDTSNEIAFFIMDLEQAGLDRLGNRFLNRYLRQTGDFGAVPLLPFYKIYRALVRAKVIAIRLGQPDLDASERERVSREFQQYLQLADRYTRPAAPWMAIMRGVSGTGKSALALALAAERDALVIHSDVERKRIYGMQALQRQDTAGLNSGIYSSASSERTYQRLWEAGRELAEKGHRVILDATFLRVTGIEEAAKWCNDKAIPLFVIELQGTPELLRARVSERHAGKGDPSDADIEVLEAQLAGWQPLATSASLHLIRLDADQSRDALLQQLLRETDQAH